MFFKLFTSCKITLGAKYSTIVDTQRGYYHSIPNTLFYIIKDLEQKKIEDIKNEIDDDSQSIFDSYIEFLTNNEFGFITNNYNEFVYLNNIKINKPSNNFIIEFSPYINENVIRQLEIINTEALHINFYKEINILKLKMFLSQIMQTTSIRFISILLIYNSEFDENTLLEMITDYPVVGNIFLYLSPFEKIINSDSFSINYILDDHISFKNCGIINSSYFSCNSHIYNESHCFNSCLAGKMSIDINGNIKNCPSMPQSFGNIKNTPLKEALNHDDFKKYWNLTKDNIEVCKDCEFRYICTDCRAYTEQTNTNKDGLDISKPLKCGYDPYTGEWEEWSTNPLKQKAIKYYKIKN